MKNLNTMLNTLLQKAFADAGFGDQFGKVELCQNPQFGDFQCNDAMSAAKIAKKAPMVIAQEVLKQVPENELIQNLSVVQPGFINIQIKPSFLAEFVPHHVACVEKELKQDDGHTTVVVDYGGPNVAKPLHVGHLRSAIIGESIKRIISFLGFHTIGDIHLGDWGLQMGMIISQLQVLHPDWVYFDPNYKGKYPTESPLTLQDLTVIYPQASARAKNDEVAMEQARKATFDLQNGRPGYLALWKHFVNLSVADAKSIYDQLDVNFDLWLGESDANDYCKIVIDAIIAKKMAYESQGALILDVARPEDTKEVPPFMLIKSDGSLLYSTTDLATLKMREEKLAADWVVYVVDNRQEMHFTQLFRAVEKTQVLTRPMKLEFAGFGTMNGKDGKPYKTREGGVMQLKSLLEEVRQKALEKINVAKTNLSFSDEELDKISRVVARATLKFADLSIFRSKDYVFDLDKFCSFEGKTGPYLLYTDTRIKSVLNKNELSIPDGFKMSIGDEEKELMLTLAVFDQAVLAAYENLAPSFLCDYVYKLANQFNNFYAKNNILKETDINKKQTWIYLCKLVLSVMEKTLYLLGIETLDRM